MKQLLFIILCITLLSGCKTKTLHVPVGSTKIEYKDRFLKDSIYLKDSVILKQKGDTVFLEKYKTIYQYKNKTDSIFKTDTIKVPYPVIEIQKVKAPYSLLEKILIALGCVSFGIIGFSIYKRFK